MFLPLNKQILFFVALKIIQSSSLYCFPIRSEDVLPCRILGSKLHTETRYVIDMQKQNPGAVILTTEENFYINGNATGLRLQHISNLDKETLKRYTIEGHKYNGVKWKFVASALYPGWYKLEHDNRFMGKGYMTWSLTTDYNQSKGSKVSSNFLVVTSNRSETDFLMKPVIAKQPDGQEYHQLKMKKYPNGKVAWSKQKEHFHFPKIFHGERKDLERYEKGNKNYNDTLFLFKDIHKDSTKYKNCDGSDGETDLENSGKTNVLKSFFSVKLAVLIHLLKLSFQYFPY